MVEKGRRGTGVRVTGGRLRGRRLDTLPGLDLRPTSDKVKEALFSILGGRLEGARVVDLFAGTGALGIEALSRGAAQVTFVENGRESLAILRANLVRLGDPAEASVAIADAVSPAVWGRGALSADLILADPPYRRGWPERILAVLAGSAALAGGGVLVIEHESGIEPGHEAWEAFSRRRYGDTTLSFFRRAAGATPPEAE